MKLEISASLLAILNQAEINLHKLKNTWPCGIRSVDDETDRRIESTKAFISDLRQKLSLD